MTVPSLSKHNFSAIWRMASLLSLLLVMIVSGCESRGERTGQISIDRSFTTDGFRWDSGALVYIFVKVRENQGKVEVCAAHMVSEGAAYTARHHTDVLAAAIIIVDGSRVMRGIDFANVIPLMDDVAGQPATCVRGTVGWKPSYAGASVDVKIPRMRFVI